MPVLWVYRAEDFETLVEEAGFQVETSFRSAMDPFGSHGLLGRPVTGDGLPCLFDDRKP